ncbi:PHB depolymerase family esterase [Ochrobactrum sp. GPK 3]
MIKKSISIIAATTLMTAVAGTCYATEMAASLPKLNIDPARIGITGISSGAYMAIQAQLSYPEIFKRAGIVAGGPYGCGESVDMAGSQGADILSCMSDGYSLDTATAKMSDQNIASWAALASSRATYMWIADGVRFISGLENLKKDGLVYLLHGTKDTVVLPIVAEAAKKVYQQLTVIKKQSTNNATSVPLDMEIIDDGGKDFAHTFPTDQPRDATCDTSVFPYIGHCGIDGAKMIFANLWGWGGQTPGTVTGQLFSYDQTTVPLQKEAQMDDAGYVYVPKACQEGKKCGIMVALHGCNQSANSTDPDGKDPLTVGNRFAKDTGFNRWADAYDMVVVYPQVKPDLFGNVTKSNFNGCWDWWGYTGKNFDQRSSAQINYLVNTVKALGYKFP